MKTTKFFYSAVIILMGVLLLNSCGFQSDREYDEAISTADELFDQEKYEEAKTFYEKAWKTKPNEEYPASRIDEIDNILASLIIEEEEYNNKLKEADDLYNNKMYETALLSYKEAMLINQDEQYPKDMISKIEKLLAEEQEIIVEEDSPYHIVVGSFQVESNAIRLQQELLAKGFNSRLVSRFGGNFHAVTYSSFPDIHSAYNNLPPVQNQFDEEDVWVVYHK